MGHQQSRSIKIIRNISNKECCHSPKKLTDEEIEKISQTTKLSRNEVLQWHNGFMADCPSGKLEKKTFVKFYKQLYPNGDAEEFCKLAFIAYDKDKNGYIDFEEFINALSVAKTGRIEDKLALAFELYDVNGDGVIERCEAYKIISSLFKLYGETMNKDQVDKLVERLISHFDKDSNGVLNKEEFINGCLNDSLLCEMIVPK